MTMAKRNIYLTLFILGLFLLTSCSVSLASDITPPPYSESYAAQDTPVATDSIYPIVPPDPQNGAIIYTEKCAPCHGPLGLGDGPQSGDLPVPVPALGDRDFAAGVRPVDWYTMVTRGNMERYMPGFTSLDDRQRWDVVAYALSLSIPAEAKAAGEEIYNENCLSCHGEEGEGGKDAPNWKTESGRLAQMSLVEIYSVTASGIGDMPGYGDSLSNEELTSVAFYVRSLSFVDTDDELISTPAPITGQEESGAAVTAVPMGTAEQFPPPNNPDVEATIIETSIFESPTTIVVKGKLEAEPGIMIPENLTVTLVGFDSMDQVYEAQTEVQPDGSYEFGNVEYALGRAYMATVDYQGLTFSSDVYHSLDSFPVDEIELPIAYYETTTDLSALRADRLHIFFDFTRSEVIQVVELFIFNNTGNRVIVPEQPGGGVIEYDLPEGAVNLQFQDSSLGDRYIQTENGFADSASILPGEGSQILFAYDLPYSRKMNVDIPIPVPVDAAVIMLPSGTMKATSDQLQSTGSRDVQGISLDMYSASNLAAGSTLEITLSGKVTTTTGLEAGNTTGLLIGGGVLGLVLVGAGIWLWRQNKPGDDEDDLEADPPVETEDEIMDAIITLDDSYKAGDLPEEAYQARRAELKNKLQSLKK